MKLHLLVFPVEMAANRLLSSSSNFNGSVAERSLNPDDLGVSTGRDSAMLKWLINSMVFYGRNNIEGEGKRKHY